MQIVSLTFTASKDWALHICNICRFSTMVPSIHTKTHTNNKLKTPVWVCPLLRPPDSSKTQQPCNCFPMIGNLVLCHKSPRTTTFDIFPTHTKQPPSPTYTNLPHVAARPRFHASLSMYKMCGGQSSSPDNSAKVRRMKTSPITTMNFVTSS